MPSPFLELRDLRKHFGSTRAVDGVSLSINQGEIFGLLGPNGAGKTTLLSIISGLLDADGGVMLIQGKGFARHDRSLRRQLGLVPQELAIYQELSGRENLRFFAELYGLPAQTRSERIDAILEAVGLTAHADQRVATYSGGMKRRLNLGVALIHSPPLLLLDEPTTGVDPQSRHHIFEEVRRLHRLGTTIIYTSHYMEEVQALCERIAIMDQGKLIACDSLAGLLKVLPGRVRFRVKEASPQALDELRRWQGMSYRLEDGQHLLESADVTRTVFQLAGWANQHGLAVESLEMEEPNLERVFLHLTGRALRD